MLPTNSVLVSWETYGEDVLSLEYNPTMIAVGLMDQINVTRDGSDYLWYITSLGNVPNGKLNANPGLNSNYQVVVVATKDMGTGKNGKFPLRLLSDLKIFKDFTLITSEPTKINTVVMGRKIWESISIEHQPLPGCLNVVRTGSGNPDITTARNVVIGESMVSALELLTASPYCLSIEKMFVIGGGQILREAINVLGCGAIHLTEIEASIKCETFIPSVDTTLFQPWYLSLSSMENIILYLFPTYVSVINVTVEILGQVNGRKCNSFSYFAKLEVKKFSFLPKMIFEKHKEHTHLRLVQDIISNGTPKDDRTGIGELGRNQSQVDVLQAKLMEVKARIQGFEEDARKELEMGLGLVDRSGISIGSWSRNIDFSSVDNPDEETWIRICNQHGSFDEQDGTYIGEVLQNVQMITGVMESIMKRVIMAESEISIAKEKVTLGQDEIKKKVFQIESMSMKLEEMERFALGTNCILKEMRQRVENLVEETFKQRQRPIENEHERNIIESLKSYVSSLINMSETLLSSEKQFQTIERLLGKLLHASIFLLQKGSKRILRVIQTDAAAINPGISGSPLLDFEGEINTAIFTSVFPISNLEDEVDLEEEAMISVVVVDTNQPFVDTNQPFVDLNQHSLI
ncbi:hypothetical protein U1Q18_015495 [Sarracenia purpurea var. burkii]